MDTCFLGILPADIARPGQRLGEAGVDHHVVGAGDLVGEGVAGFAVAGFEGLGELEHDAELAATLFEGFVHAAGELDALEDFLKP